MTQEQTPQQVSDHPYAALRHPKARLRPPLLRRRPRVFFGVCRGLAVHLGGSVTAWRIIFLLLIPTFIIPIFYLVIAAVVPTEAQAAATPAVNDRLASRLGEKREKIIAAERARRRNLLVLAGLFLLGGLGILAVLLGADQVLGISSLFWVNTNSLIGIMLFLVGAAVVWSTPADETTGKFALALSGATVSALGGIVFVLSLHATSILIAALASAFVTVLVLVIVLYPVYLRLRFNLRASVEANARQAERTEIATHLHDSVLQTLALIRAQANDADAVRTLARTQEQDLRRYLYTDRQEVQLSLAEQLREMCQNLERRYGAVIELVVTGDAVPNEANLQIVAAAGEAVTNACKHGGNKEISVYAELASQRIEIWVRDRGPGFNPEQIPADRAGVRDSIIGRMEKIGGSAEIRSPLTSGGTEVHLASSSVE